MLPESPFLSRDELLGGLPAHRASMLLFAIENRTARLAAQDREAIVLVLSPKTAEERERVFLEAVAEGRDSSVETCIQDLERYARDWQPLVPDDANLCAAVAHLLAQKYRFTPRNVPGMRLALELDTQGVQQAYLQLYNQPISTIYIPESRPPERIRWAWASLAARLENLPPFWMAFLLTLPGQAGLLAMPIALAGIGLSTGMAILILFGIINMLTAAAMAEAAARSGTTRFGLGFLVPFASEYLGPAAAALVSVVLSLNNFFVLIVFFLGVAGTLQDATHLPGLLWSAVLFGACLYFLYRRSFGATVGTTILIVIANLLITIAIPLIILPRVSYNNLAHLPLPFTGISFQPAIWQLVLGTMLSMYYSHIMITGYAPVVLRRDPGAGSWIKGSAAAILFTMVIALLWMVTVNGAVSPDVLLKTTGTVISPLAELGGPIVSLLGSVLVILSLGLSAIQVALVLYFVTNENLPARAGDRMGSRTRFLLAISPVLLVFLITEWILLSGQSSFTAFLGTLSAISLPLFGGMLPVLLLASTRRKGDFPIAGNGTTASGTASRILGSLPVLGGLYTFFLGSIFLHSLYLWSEPVTKTVAFLVAVAIFITTLLMLRQGMLRPRLVIELRQDESGGASLFNITANGQPAPAQVCLTYRHAQQEVHAATGEIAAFPLLKSVSFQFASPPAQELKVWVHRFGSDGGSRSIPVNVQITAPIQPVAYNQPETPGQPADPQDQLAPKTQNFPGGLGTLHLTGQACQVLITIGT